MLPFLYVAINILSSKLVPATSNTIAPHINPTVAFQSVPILNRWVCSPHLLAVSDPNDNDFFIKTEVPSIDSNDEEQDTVRVRIWRALAPGKELSLKHLGALVGERQKGDLKAHLQHVEKQAKTLKNKNADWRKRRGLPIDNVKKNKLRIKKRRGDKNEVYVRLG